MVCRQERIRVMLTQSRGDAEGLENFLIKILNDQFY